MNYLALLRFEIKHTYYQDSCSPDFLVEPTTATARLLRNHRAVIKPFRYGVQLYIAEDPSKPSTPLIPFTDPIRFEFALRLRNKAFASFTDLKDLVSLKPGYAPLYSNDPTTATLKFTDGVKADRDVFATARIQASFDALNSVGNPTLYHLQFTAAT